MPRINIFAHKQASQVFDGLINSITNEIKEKEDDYKLNIDENEWQEYFVEKFELTPLKIYPDKARVEFAGKEKRFVEQYGRRFELEEFRFEIHVPFSGSSQLFMLQPSSFVMRTAEVYIENAVLEGNVIGYVTMQEQNKDLFEREKSSFISLIQLNVENVNRDVQSYNQRIIPHFNNVLSSERERIKKERSFFESINVSIDKSTEEIFKAPTIKRKRIPEPKIEPGSRRKYVSVPTFSDELYHDILKVIYDLFKNVEKKPSIYKSKGEEDLRDYLLPFIETRYVGTTATGETFNKVGKTDILLKYQDGSNLFVAECKIWKGKEVFHETINQLFDRYLTWRDSKVAIIMFVPNKDFSAVLDTIKESVKEHPYFFRENGQRGESSFSYIFNFPDDSQKLVYTEIMAFAFTK
ncbi:MAG: hypothetical protein DYG98_22965 [Haliscomenobacteraceae bacterium CHB4]|nr:hypothetical protein [Haliscomenobacteraceae bacterium CHB4]